MQAHLRVLRSEDGLLVLSSPQPASSPLLDQGSHAIARIDTGATTFVVQVAVAGRTTDGSYLISMSELVERFPKRRYFRTAVELPLFIGGHDGQVLDLSGCGLLADLPDSMPLEPRDVLLAQITLEEGDRVELALCAVRIGNGERGRRHVGFDFMAPDDTVQDRIISYVMKQHRRKLRFLR